MEVKTTNKVTGVIIHSETWLLASELWLLVLMQPIEQLLVSQQPAQLILGLQAPCPCPALCLEPTNVPFLTWKCSGMCQNRTPGLLLVIVMPCAVAARL